LVDTRRGVTLKSISESRDNLIDDLEVEENGFDDINKFRDNQYGFSARKKLSIKNLADKKYYSLLRVFFLEKNFSCEDSKKTLEIKLDFSYLDEDGDYIFPFVGGESIKVPTTAFLSDVHYDTEKRLFFKGKKKILPKALLKLLNDAHLRPTKRIRGLPFRIGLRLYFITQIFLNILERVLSFTFFILCGVRYKFNPFTRDEEEKLTPSISMSPKHAPELNIPDPKESTILGYKGSQWILFIYSLIHLILYFLPFTKSNKITFIFTNTFLTAVYIVVTLGIYEYGIPKFLKWIIKKVSSKRFYLAFKEIHIKV
jgi:hypothetical protein